MIPLDMERNEAPVRTEAPPKSTFMRRKGWGFVPDPEPDAPMCPNERRVLQEALTILRKRMGVRL